MSETADAAMAGYGPFDRVLTEAVSIYSAPDRLSVAAFVVATTAVATAASRDWQPAAIVATSVALHYWIAQHDNNNQKGPGRPAQPGGRGGAD